LKGKVVVINAFFTTCHDSCPVMAERFAKIQSWLGDRLGKKVHLISMSVDPESDTPARLKEFAAKFNARPGWYLLSGKKENVDFVLHKLGQSVSDKNDHLNIFLIGNEPTGLWKKARGTAAADELIRILESVLNDSLPSSGRSQ